MTETVTPLKQFQYLVKGSQTVSIGLGGTAGAGTITVSSIAVIDSILYLDTNDSTVSANYVTKASANPTANTIAVFMYTNTLSGPTIATRATGTYTTYYTVLGH